jgi:hypothetical protein
MTKTSQQISTVNNNRQGEEANDLSNGFVLFAVSLFVSFGFCVADTVTIIKII